LLFRDDYEPPPDFEEGLLDEDMVFHPEKPRVYVP